MGALGINMAEKRLLQHLSRGGLPTDEVGNDLIAKFAEKATSDSTIAPILRRYGLTAEEVAALYSAVIEDLMPEPWMNVSGPMLVPTQWFMEPHRLEELLEQTHRGASRNDPVTWLTTLTENATALARATKDAHDQAYGKPRLRTSQPSGQPASGGCMMALTLAVAIPALLTYAFLV